MNLSSQHTTQDISALAETFCTSSFEPSATVRALLEMYLLQNAIQPTSSESSSKKRKRQSHVPHDAVGFVGWHLQKASNASKPKGKTRWDTVAVMELLHSMAMQWVDGGK
jgi:hypothetical protein